MFVVDDKHVDFYETVSEALTNRGADFLGISDLHGTTASGSFENYLALVDKSFDCLKDKKFIEFLKKNKFKKAILLKMNCDKLNIKHFYNSAVTILEAPSTLEKNSLLRLYYLHTFLEIALKNTPNLPCAADNTAKLVNLIRKISSTNATVLINGPTGTGKEVVSNLIHSFSERRNHSFIALNCAAIPDQMLESILFGHQKGSFTGAVQSNEGLLRAADGGTILLDEISEMPINLQSKLLRVIQEKKVMPIGSTSEIEVDVRIVATTNRNMFDEVKLGNFREDLFYRLNVFPVNNQSLRTRIEDVIPITAHILYKSYLEKSEIISISEDALSALMQHSWPGNVRELDNIIQRAKILCCESAIEIADLIFDTDGKEDQPNTAEILAAKFKTAAATEVIS